MIPRPFWLRRLEQAWREAPIAWLRGVRRSGKTTLAESLGEDRILYVFGALWEHFVLEHLQALFPDLRVRYWRDKSGREVDFVLARRRDAVDAIECKWDPAAFDSSALQVFRGFYPKGRNHLATSSGEPAYTRRFGKLEVRICTPSELHP